MTVYIPDTLSYPAAMQLKAKIEDHWFRHGLRGVKVHVVCEECSKDARPIYVIRSNITFDAKGYPAVKPERLTYEPDVL